MVVIDINQIEDRANLMQLDTTKGYIMWVASPWIVKQQKILQLSDILLKTERLLVLNLDMIFFCLYSKIFTFVVSVLQK